MVDKKSSDYRSGYTSGFNAGKDRNSEAMKEAKAIMDIFNDDLCTATGVMQDDIRAIILNSGLSVTVFEVKEVVEKIGDVFYSAFRDLVDKRRKR